MRVFSRSHLRLALAEFPLLFAISYFPTQVSEKRGFERHARRTGWRFFWSIE